MLTKLPPPQLAVLQALQEKPNQTQGELGDLLGRSGSGIRETLKALQRQGLVRHQETTTPAGRKGLLYRCDAKAQRYLK